MSALPIEVGTVADPTNPVLVAYIGSGRWLIRRFGVGDMAASTPVKTLCLAIRCASAE